MSKLIPYKDTFLTFSHYKEPLREVPNGFGYLGALLGTIDGEHVQCHICGQLCVSLGTHAKNKHALTPTEYKEKFQIAKLTGLISEKERDRRKMKSVQYFASLSPEEWAAYNAKRKAGWKKYKQSKDYKNRIQPKQTLETYNKRGTCPDQLLDKIKQVAEKLGHTPTKAEFIAECETQRYVHLIYKTFGSWTKALAMIGREVEPQPRKKRIVHTNDELLEYIQIFFQENQKIPTHTDCKRGLLPAYDVYIRRFGSFPKARELAGISEVPTRWGVKS